MFRDDATGHKGHPCLQTKPEKKRKVWHACFVSKVDKWGQRGQSVGVVLHSWITSVTCQAKHRYASLCNLWTFHTFMNTSVDIYGPHKILIYIWIQPFHIKVPFWDSVSQDRVVIVYWGIFCFTQEVWKSSPWHSKKILFLGNLRKVVSYKR